MKLIGIPSLIDNYIWLLIHNNNCVIVDPGIARPVLVFLHLNNIKPVAIFLTHHHYDHVNGVKELRERYPELIVYGPMETSDQGATYIIKCNEQIKCNGFLWQTFSIPGHTLDHIAYYHRPYLFCGDTIFSGGCGRILEGTTKQMYFSLKKLKTLPNDTLICCAHEYTATNMAFANYLLPHDIFIKSFILDINQKLSRKEFTVPSQLAIEKKINIFLGSHNLYLKKVLGLSSVKTLDFDIFVKIRKLKDCFKIDSCL